MADYTETLKDSRRARQEKSSPVSKGIKNPKGIAKDIKNFSKPGGAFAMLKHVDFLKDMPFFCAFGFAILKDILDFISLTGFLYILTIVFSLLCSIFIFMMLLLAGSSGKKKQASAFAKKAAVLIGGGLADAAPAVGILPIETFTVFILYLMALSERANAQE